MKNYFLIYFFLLLYGMNFNGYAQEDGAKPKLIVGIVVDQMRFDYINKYWDKFSEGGFKRLVNQGCYFTNANYDYVPTYTGPGHATIYTGVSPSIHGICANVWLGKDGNGVYCVEDKKVLPVDNDIVGGVSPGLLKAPTLSDLLKTDSSLQSKIISLSLKDRSAVLPGGQNADGVYWYDSKRGNMVTSSFYKNELPFWAKDFNSQGFPDKHLSKGWETILHISQYTESGPDNSVYETPFVKGGRVTFPYDLDSLKERQGYGILKSTPYGNTFTRDFAIAAMEGEQLGRGKGTDALFVSFSSTDYVGHQFGPESIELEDTYLRLDVDLAEMIAYIQGILGKDKVLFFLTSDHGVVDVPQYLVDNQKPGGYYSHSSLKDSLNTMLKGIVEVLEPVKSIMNQNIYLDSALQRIDSAMFVLVLNEIQTYLKKQSYVSEVVMPQLENQENTKKKLVQMAMKGYFPGRSGEVIFLTKEGWIDSEKRTGTTHGSGYEYDTHVPLLFYGWKVTQKKVEEDIRIEQIVPTILKELGIESENAYQFPPLLIH